MTLQEFINKWNNKGIDFDGYYGDQCMDLMHQYLVDVLGIADGRTLAAADAKTVYLNFNNIFNHQLFEKIANTPTGVPKAGDIILWGTGIGPYGHVAIFVSGDANKFKSFDQNFPTGSKCHIQDHTYTGVLGWLRYKAPINPCAEMLENAQDELIEIRASRDKWKTDYRELETKTAKEIADLRKHIEALQESYNLANESAAKTALELKDARTDISKLEGDIGTLTGVKNALEVNFEASKAKELEHSIRILELENDLSETEDELATANKKKLESFSKWQRFISLF